MQNTNISNYDRFVLSEIGDRQSMQGVRKVEQQPSRALSNNMRGSVMSTDSLNWPQCKKTNQDQQQQILLVND